MDIRSLTLSALTFAAVALAQSQSAGQVPVPAQALSAGYSTETFFSEVTPGDVDTGKTYKSGYKWYCFNFFSSSMPCSLNWSGGAATIANGSSAGEISTASSTGGSGWVGTAFGGGFYAEAMVAFNPAAVNLHPSNYWPAFWSESLEHSYGAGTADHWSGQAPNYEHFSELDIFEYMGGGLSNYISTIHDFWGIFKSTCLPNQFCQVNNAYGGGSDYSDNHVVTTAELTQFHKYGVLWTPATASANGSVVWYFDGVAQKTITVTWSLFTNQAPPPGKAAWTFGAIDQQHMYLILDSGANEPMQVAYVGVWQASDAGNLRH